MRDGGVVARLQAMVGQELGVSGWREVTQAAIDGFADVTGDDQFIHVDPVRAAQTPFGGTVAHGFLTLSLLSILAREAIPATAERRMGINYGLDRVRFLAPVPSGARVRGRFTLTECTPREAGEVRLRYAATVEIEGMSKPALLADWIVLARFGDGEGA